MEEVYWERNTKLVIKKFFKCATAQTIRLVQKTPIIAESKYFTNWQGTQFPVSHSPLYRYLFQTVGRRQHK